jgi:hypothetical protein
MKASSYSSGALPSASLATAQGYCA